jgi:cytochrome c oxidase assembly protein subunit 15
MQKLTYRLAIAAAIGMFVVIAQGALVTNTGSAEGCGRSWPLCHGEFVPAYAFETMVEFSHRFVTSIEGVLILATAAGALYYWRRRTEIRIFVPLMVLFLFIQAGLGAAAVMWPQTPEIMALHFGISLVAFASALLTAVVISEMRNGREKLRDRPVPRSFAYAAWGLTAYTYLVVYLGAYVRHKEVDLACTDWPLCNGSVFPGFSGPVGLVFGHRVSALVAVIGTGVLIWWAYRLRESRPDLLVGSLAAGVFVLAQAFSGAYVVWSQLDVFSTMSHGVFVTLYFGALSFLSLHVLPLPASAHQAEPAVGDQRPASRPTSGLPYSP